MNEYINMLCEKTLKAKTKLASEFVKQVVIHAPKAANFAENCVWCVAEDNPYVSKNGMYVLDDCYYVTYPKRMNHEHAEKVLERIGFNVYWEYGKIERITWPTK